MKRMRIKALISSMLILLLLAVSVSGAILYFGKTGVVLGFTRAFLLRFHAWCGLLFLAFGACHLALNFKLLTQEIRRLYGRR